MFVARLGCSMWPEGEPSLGLWGDPTRVRSVQLGLSGKAFQDSI